MPVSDRLRILIAQQYPWMNDEMLTAYEGSWSEFEDTKNAIAAVRATGSYKSTFPGNFDPVSGQVRMSETEYFATKASFDAALEGIGVNSTFFQDEWISALEGEVSPNEMLTRIEAAYERIIDAAPEIRDFYSKNYGIDMSDAAILASALSPRIGESILNKQISIAEIGGSAAQRGFDISGGFAEQLANIRGLDEDSFFGEARGLIPAINILQARHADPDDEFDLEDVASAFLFDDPETRRMIRRLQAQESSTFTGGATIDYKRTQAGGLSGLTET